MFDVVKKSWGQEDGCGSDVMGWGKGKLIRIIEVVVNLIENIHVLEQSLERIVVEQWL